MFAFEIFTLRVHLLFDKSPITKSVKGLNKDVLPIQKCQQVHNTKEWNDMQIHLSYQFALCGMRRTGNRRPIIVFEAYLILRMVVLWNRVLRALLCLSFLWHDCISEGSMEVGQGVDLLSLRKCILNGRTGKAEDTTSLEARPAVAGF
jgi:hypothetical protein